MCGGWVGWGGGWGVGGGVGVVGWGWGGGGGRNRKWKISDSELVCWVFVCFVFAECSPDCFSLLPHLHNGAVYLLRRHVGVCSQPPLSRGVFAPSSLAAASRALPSCARYEDGLRSRDTKGPANGGRKRLYTYRR